MRRLRLHPAVLRGRALPGAVTGSPRTPQGHPHDYVLVPATRHDAVPLVLLHGSDGRETDLLPLAERLAPAAAKVSVRGAVRTPGGYAFFRRFPDRRIDEEDLTGRLQPFTQLIGTALTELGLHRRPVAVGYSNGAIMAAAALQTNSDLFAGAVLFRPLSPFTVAPITPLNGLPVLVLDGADDDRRRPGDGRVLAESLRRVGADVCHEVLPTGHGIGELDEEIAGRWLERHDG